MAKDVSIRLHAQLDSVEKKRSRLDQENEELRVRLQEQEVAKQVLQQEVDKVGLEFCWLKPIFWGTHDNIGGHGYVYDRSFSVENSTFMFRKAQTCKDCSCTLSVGLKQTKFHFSLAANEQTTKRPKYIILKLLLFELITWIQNQPEKHLFLAYRLLGCLLGQFSSFFFSSFRASGEFASDLISCWLQLWHAAATPGTFLSNQVWPRKHCKSGKWRQDKLAWK